MEETNIFKLWESQGKIVPFTVTKGYWPVGGLHVKVEKVEVIEGTQGKVYGQYYQKGKARGRGLIITAAAHHWKMKTI